MEFSTGQVARIMGVHPNTVRLYEKLGFISPARRLPNAYRRFNDEHLLQFRVARLALKAEITSNGLREDAIALVKASGEREYREAIELCRVYQARLADERMRAEAAVRIASSYAAKKNALAFAEQAPRKRKDAALELGVTVDVLRNWELNGLIAVRRASNGYRIYTPEDMERLRVIRALRCADYSLSAILRLMLALDKGEQDRVGAILDGEGHVEEIVRACDHLVEALTNAQKDARAIAVHLERATTASKNGCRI